jgi:hypothetical protein
MSDTVVLRNWKGWAMPGESDAYLEAFGTADKLVREIKVMAFFIDGFAQTIKDPQSGPYQTVPANWPTAQQIQDRLNAAKSAWDNARTLYQQVPHHLKAHLPEPDSIGGGKGRMNIDEDDRGYRS